MFEAFIKLLLIVLLTCIFRIIEYARDLSINQRSIQKGIPLFLFYRAFYIHLGLCMAAIGLLCDQLTAASLALHAVFSVLLVIILTALGCIFRGLFSNHSPDAMSWSDKDWRNGLIIPNIFGFSAIIFSFLNYLW